MKIIAAVIAAIAGLVFLVSQGSSFISEIKTQVSGLTSQATDLLPDGDTYALGLAEGEKILENSSYLDQLNISLLPGAAELIASIKSGQITEERISEIAGLYFPVAAVKAGILDISAENKAEFIRGVLDGYFPVQ
jgi:hypothetical protein